jgi:hypothetical protein
MAGYLDQYGAGEERRNRIIIRSIIAVLVIIVVATLSWYLLLNHHEEGLVKQFVAALKRGDTQGAYKIWNCKAADTCRDYTYEKFMRDWGPGANGPDLATIGLTDSEECNNGVMLTLRVNANRVEQLWVDRGGTNSISFAPYPICPAQIPYEIMVHRSLGKLRKILLQ